MALAAPTDALLDHADALVALAQVLRLSGDEAGAVVHARAAVDLYDRKEAIVPASQLRPGGSARVSPAPATAAPGAAQADAPPRPENLATKVMGEMAVHAARNDAEGFLLLCRTDVCAIDRRPITGGAEVTGWAEYAAHTRGVLDVGVREIVVRPLELRGDRLALSR